MIELVNLMYILILNLGFIKELGNNISRLFIKNISLRL